MLPAMLAILSPSAQQGRSIDRHALVTRHNVTLTAFDGERPIQVGNGEFAFGMDVTGLQTFAPFNTMSQWGWHSSLPPNGKTADDFKGQVVDTHGRPVRYPLYDPAQADLSYWLSSSPHKINLGRLGLVLTKRDGALAGPEDLQNPRQHLDLWTGIVTSRFELEGQPVTVKTGCHPTLDSVAVQVESPLIEAGRLAVFLACPGNNPLQMANFVGDWSQPGRFEIPSSTKRRADLVRRIDNDAYHVSLTWQGDATLLPPQAAPPTLEIVKAEYGASDKWLDVTDLAQRKVSDGRLELPVGNSLGPDPINGVPKTLRVIYKANGKTQRASAKENEDLLIDAAPERSRLTLRPAPGAKVLSFVCAFSPRALPKTLPDAPATFAASRQNWPKFWREGGAIDLSGSRDPRWRELERRIVLSQYLMRVNEAGSWPPQESGLVNNGWYGRFHLEMVWWHSAQWALWDRWPLLNRSLGFYDRLLSSAQRTAKEQGYVGARWPKCPSLDGREWPHEIHAFLAWQQPHPIFFAELDYRAHPTRATLERWRPIVEATADFMASYAFWDAETRRYVLGPPIHLVSENTNPRATMNPAFELGYWRFGLRTAQEWRRRLKLAPRPEWAKVLRGLSPLPTQEGRYVTHEGIQEMWTKFNFEHPALIGTYGMLPGDGVDRPTMARTLDKVAETWNFNHTWGWDFPMLAMNAARMGRTDRAMDYLLHPSPNFQFDVRGLATGGPFPYFPSNGGLLYAVAMMAAGWDGAPKRNAPGFPSDGRWKVRWENLRVAP
ncbi:MAG: hypothetical protein ACO1SV_13785 [Fimbriimonas sp.]